MKASIICKSCDTEFSATEWQEYQVQRTLEHGKTEDQKCPTCLKSNYIDLSKGIDSRKGGKPGGWKKQVEEE